jgi:DNA-binding PadR family transcriptional regulator
VSLQGALAALLLQGPAHGYQLHATLEGELGPLWETRASQLYLTLGRMQRDGLVTALRVRQENRPDRQLLELTPKGRTVAERWLWSADRAELVVRLAVARIAAPGRFEDVAAAAVQERSEALARLRALRDELADHGFQVEAAEAEVLRVQAELRWAAAIRDRAAKLVARPRAATRRAGRAGDARPA